jgi:hypothetical protein
MRLVLADNNPRTKGLTVSEINPKMLVPGELHSSGVDTWVREDFFDYLPNDQYNIIMDYIDDWIEIQEDPDNNLMGLKGRWRARRERKARERAERKRKKQEARTYRANLRAEAKAELIRGRAAIKEAEATYGASTGQFRPRTVETITRGLVDIAPAVAGIIGAATPGFPGDVRMPWQVDEFGNVIPPPPPPPPQPMRILGMHPALAVGLGLVLIGGVIYAVTTMKKR